MFTACVSFDDDDGPAIIYTGSPTFAGIEDPLDGPGERKAFRLAAQLLFEKDRLYNARVGLDLSFARWVEPLGERYVLVDQRQPSYRLHTWGGGLLEPTFNADLTSLVDLRDPQGRPFTDQASEDARRAIRFAIERLDAWQTEYADLMRGRQWVFNPEIAFYAPRPFPGSYGFFRTLDGSVLVDGDGRLQERALLDKVEMIYRWTEPGKPDPVHPPEFFKALTAMLAVFNPSPLPPGGARALAAMPVGERWTTRNEWTVSAVVRTARYLNEELHKRLDPARRASFDVAFELARRDPEIVEIAGAAVPFSEPVSFGLGYTLVAATRRIELDGKTLATRADRVRVQGRGAGNDRFELVLDLEEAK